MKMFWVIFLIILAIAVIGLGPFLTIMSINTLFALSIPYNIYTWLSTLWLGMCLFPSKSFSTK